MSILSNIRRSHKEAREHASKLAEQQRKEQECATAYRHVPTHAATDAFASAPPSWREAGDRPKIIEQNRRRSAMAASGNIPSPNYPRVGSSLSYVSYPGPSETEDINSPTPRLPRAYSYNGGLASPGQIGDVIYSIPDDSHPDSEEGFKDAMESQSDSTGSHEDLQMKSNKARVVVITQAAKAYRHRSTNLSRNASDISIDQQTSTGLAQIRSDGYSNTRDSKPPPSSRGFKNLPMSMTMVPVGTRAVPLPAAAIAPTAAWHSQASSTNPSKHPSTVSLQALEMPVSGPSDGVQTQQPSEPHGKSALINHFPELIGEANEDKKTKTKRLSKGGPGILRKYGRSAMEAFA